MRESTLTNFLTVIFTRDSKKVIILSSEYLVSKSNDNCRRTRQEGETKGREESDIDNSVRNSLVSRGISKRASSIYRGDVSVNILGQAT